MFIRGNDALLKNAQNTLCHPPTVIKKQENKFLKKSQELFFDLQFFCRISASLSLSLKRPDGRIKIVKEGTSLENSKPPFRANTKETQVVQNWNEFLNKKEIRKGKSFRENVESTHW